MYIELMLLVIIAMPISAIYRQILNKARPYKAIGTGVMFATVGVILVFLLAYLSGNSLGAIVDKGIESTVNMIVNNKEALEMLGMASVSKASAISTLTQMYSAVASMLPAVLMILAAIVSYIEYNILVRIRYRKIKGFKPLAYIRNFSLKSNDVMGWFIIYLGAYLLKFAGLAAANAAVMNINILVESIIALQGISLVFLFCHSKRMMRGVPVILVIFMWMLPIGKTVLFTLGLLDLLLNFRGRLV